jgi:hypothetical protein
MAAVMPNNKKDLTDKLENRLFEFVWKRFCKITRNEAKLPLILGGLGLPDLKSTWMAFKFFMGDAPCYSILNAQLTRSTLSSGARYSS